MSENIELRIAVEKEEDLRASGHGDEPLFHASWFKVTEQISRSYLLRIRVASRADSLDLKALLGRRVLLTESRDLGGADGKTYERRFHGVITSAQQRNYNRGLGLYTYWLDCRPALDALAMSTRCRVFGADTPRSLPELVNFLLTDSYSGKVHSDLDPIKAKIDYKTDYKEAEQDYKPRAFVVQYNESDLDFLQRQLERYGVFYFFDPSRKTEKLIVSDYNGAFCYTGSGDDPDGVTWLHFVEPTHYAPGHSFKVKDFIPRCSWRQKELTRYDYHYAKPSTDLKFDVQLDRSGEGALSLYGGNLMPDEHDEGELLTRRTGELIMSDQEYFTGKSDCFQLAPGFTFPLTGHFNKAYDSKAGHGYLVTEVAHECSVPLPGEPWNGKEHGHSADFTAIRADTTYRPAKTTPIPRVPGPIPAIIDSAGNGLRADLDDKGRYLVHTKFDIGGAPDGKHSPRLRLGQAYAGTTEGIGFPLRKGAEVLIGFVDGDIDRPVIQNAVPNPQHTSPVTEHYHTRSRLITASAITLEMDDGTGELGDDTAHGEKSPPVAAPPVAEPLSEAPVAQRPLAAANDMAARERKESSLSEIDDTKNWVRLFLTHKSQQSYLRLGAVPSDEASGHVKGIGDATLPGEEGWLDYTEGDRTSGTLGNSCEVVGGKQRLVVGEPSKADGAILDHDAGRTLLIEDGESKTVYGNQTVTCTDGVQQIGSGVLDIDSRIGGEPDEHDQVLFAGRRQYLYAGDNQYLECDGNQVYEIHGNQTGTVRGDSDVKYLGHTSTTTFTGAKTDMIAGMSTELRTGGSFTGSLAVDTEVLATSIEAYGFRAAVEALQVDKTLVKNSTVVTKMRKIGTSISTTATDIRDGAVACYLVAQIVMG